MPEDDRNSSDRNIVQRISVLSFLFVLSPCRTRKGGCPSQKVQSSTSVQKVKITPDYVSWKEKYTKLVTSLSEAY